jgi:hypothetical protein
MLKWMLLMNTNQIATGLCDNDLGIEKLWHWTQFKLANYARQMRGGVGSHHTPVMRKGWS